MDSIIKISLIAAFLFSLLFKLLNYLTFARLYKAGSDMSGSDLEIIKLLKRRFSDCITLGKPIENTESYIRRILLSSDKYNATGSLKEKISIGFLLIFWGILWLGYMYGFFSYESTILCTVISMILVYITDRIFDTCALESGFITFAADYLDNTLKGRLTKSCSPRIQSNTVKSYTEKSINITADAFTKATKPSSDPSVKQNKKSISGSNASLETAATDDTELIASIINEFIL